jgi:hypothetical protein
MTGLGWVVRGGGATLLMYSDSDFDEQFSEEKAYLAGTFEVRIGCYPVAYVFDGVESFLEAPAPVLVLPAQQAMA